MAEPDSARVLPLRHGNISLTVAEADAFRADHGREKSFRAECAEALRLLVAVQARMTAELEEYRSKRTSAYLWKPHADSLAYLLRCADQLTEFCGNIIATAPQRGLAEKTNALDASLQKLRMQMRLVGRTLEGMG